MKFRLTTADFLEEINYNQQRAKVITTDAVLETQTGFTHDFGAVHFREIQLDSANILISEYDLKKPLMLYNRLEEGLIEMHFNLEHTIGLGESHHLKKGILGMSHNLFGLQGIAGFVDFSRGRYFKTFDIHLAVDYVKKWFGQNAQLDRFINDFDRQRPAMLYPESPYITPLMQDVIHQILQCPFAGFTRKIYLESKVQELFALQVAQTRDLYRTASAGFKALNPRDIALLQQAKNYIENHLSQPKSIEELAHICGTNQQKLKNGFRQLFGTTVFGYLQKCRMQAARDLLQQGVPVGEVSYSMGYANHSSFSHAFKAYFGFSPIKIQSDLRP
ncbi:helix-turn-helix domain-containing protein [Flavobacterium sp. JP2137]|uniref:helix-turn-helix domain-containing protein n=1 Tax=Flavobacterium sp. JP2137 TaxID=3414510 RepID=UPI003D2F9E41